jgi:hypothetical protein
MASVTITVGDISVGYEDEDRGAKALNRVALRTIETLVNTLTKSDNEEGEDE